MKKEGIIRVYSGLSMDERMILADFCPVADWGGSWDAGQRSRIREEYRGSYFYAAGIKENDSQDIPQSYALRYKLFSPDPSEDSMREQMQKEGYRSAIVIEALALVARLFARSERIPDIFLLDERSRLENVFRGIGRHLIHSGRQNYSEEQDDIDQYCTGEILYSRTHIEKTFLFLGVKGH